MKTLSNVQNHTAGSIEGYDWDDFSGSVALVFIDDRLHCGGIISSITKLADGGTELAFKLFAYAQVAMEVENSRRVIRHTEWVNEKGTKMNLAAEPKPFRGHLVIIDESTHTKVVIPPAAEQVLRWFEETERPLIPTR